MGESSSSNRHWGSRLRSRRRVRRRGTRFGGGGDFATPTQTRRSTRARRRYPIRSTVFLIPIRLRLAQRRPPWLPNRRDHTSSIDAPGGRIARSDVCHWNFSQITTSRGNRHARRFRIAVPVTSGSLEQSLFSGGIRPSLTCRPRLRGRHVDSGHACAEMARPATSSPRAPSSAARARS